ncbi:uncharacterized protein LOC121202248 [Betta splendens]|uniref:Uncharacterized protein LOC121202248 n=1 Tax=Betta splendens TaxID=158456 RepID=A0A8M1HET1_BETSP|nr:uncharacterized protein LOC121202248 [Betta splendens]
MKKTTSKKQQLCQFYITRGVLLKHLQLVQLKEASCDYSLEHEPNFASARSDGCSLTDSFSGIKTQGLVPPELTVTPLVITESDSVTVNCQTPSSVPVSQCHFTVTGHLRLGDSSCLQTVTGADLLHMTGQRSPAEVKLTCYYTVKLGERESTSTDSQTSSITINSLHQPELTVTPLVITESDSVTVNCQTPSSVPVYQCWLYSVRDQTSRVVSCHQTLTGTELMKMTQSSPVEIEVTCYYSVERRGTISLSQFSNSIIIQSK